MWTQIFSKTEKKVAFSNENGYVWTTPNKNYIVCFNKFYAGKGFCEIFRPFIVLCNIPVGVKRRLQIWGKMQTAVEGEMQT